MTWIIAVLCQEDLVRTRALQRAWKKSLPETLRTAALVVGTCWQDDPDYFTSYLKEVLVNSAGRLVRRGPQIPVRVRAPTSLLLLLLNVSEALCLKPDDLLRLAVVQQLDILEGEEERLDPAALRDVLDDFSDEVLEPPAAVRHVPVTPAVPALMSRHQLTMERALAHKPTKPPRKRPT